MQVALSSLIFSQLFLIAANCKMCKESDDDNCELLVEPPDSQYVKKCVPHLIDKCSEHFADKRTVRKCTAEESSTFYRYRRQRGSSGYNVVETVYRNQYCAECNGVPDSQQLACSSDSNSATDQTKPSSRIPPFSVVLDINVGYRQEREVVYGGAIEQVINIFYKICFNVSKIVSPNTISIYS